MLNSLGRRPKVDVDSVCCSSIDALKQLKCPPEYLIIASNNVEVLKTKANDLVDKSQNVRGIVREKRLFFVTEDVATNTDLGYQFWGSAVPTPTVLYQRHENPSSTKYCIPQVFQEAMLKDMATAVSRYLFNLGAKSVQISCASSVVKSWSNTFSSTLDVAGFLSLQGDNARNKKSDASLSVFYLKQLHEPVNIPSDVDQYWIRKLDQFKSKEGGLQDISIEHANGVYSAKFEMSFDYKNDNTDSIKYGVKVAANGSGAGGNYEKSTEDVKSIKCNIQAEFFTRDEMKIKKKVNREFCIPRLHVNENVTIAKTLAQNLLRAKPDANEYFAHSCVFLVFGSIGAGKSSFIRSSKIACGQKLGHLGDATMNGTKPSSMSFRTNQGTRGTSHVESYSIFDFEHEMRCKDGIWKGDVQFIDTAGFNLTDDDFNDPATLKKTYNTWINPEPNLVPIRPDGAFLVLNGVNLATNLSKGKNDVVRNGIGRYMQLMDLLKMYKWPIVVILTRKDQIIDEFDDVMIDQLVAIVHDVVGDDIAVHCVENYVYNEIKIDELKTLEQEADEFEVEAKDDPHSLLAKELKPSFESFKDFCERWKKMNVTITDPICDLLDNAIPHAKERTEFYQNATTDDEHEEE